MKSTLPDIEPISTTDYNVGRLQTWLNYELSGSVLLLLSYAYYIITLYLVAIAAIIFIPLLLKVLFEERRYGWLICFFLFITAPPLVVYVLVDNSGWLDNSDWTMIASYVSLGFFYFYCVLLRLVIPEW